MKSTGKITAILAATAAFSMLVTASASAEERHRDGTWRDNGRYERHDDGYRNRDGYRHESRNNHRFESRNNNRFEERGRISRFARERDGYRVWLDRGERSYWVPSYRLGGHRLAVGLDIRLGGIFNGTYVDVDALGWPGDPYYNDGYYAPAPAPYYNDGYLSGRVERVDYRDGTLLLRDRRTGRLINFDMRSAARRGEPDFDDVRPGDRITLDGEWDRGYFHAFRIDRLREY